MMRHRSLSYVFAIALGVAGVAGYGCDGGAASALRGHGASDDGPLADGGADGDNGSAPASVPPAGLFDRRIRRLTRAEYANTLKDLLGTGKDYGTSMPADVVVNGFDGNADALEVDALFADQARQNAEDIASTVTIANLAQCNGAQGEACARTFVQTFGAKALRRPVTSDEENRYAQLYDAVAASGGSSDAGMRAIVEAMLQSPSFLYRTELGVHGGDGFALTPYEIASELSYLYWQTMPDDELFTHAKNGDLSQPAVVAAQAARLLASPRANAMLDTFVEQWLEVDRLVQAQKDSAAYPMFNDSIRQDLTGETHAFFENVARDPQASLSTLFTASYSYLTPNLAQYYGVQLGQGSATNGFVQTPMGAERGGLLTLGSILATEASPTGANPIRRGKLVRVRVLCQAVPPPPPGLNPKVPPLDPNAPNRQKFGQHDSDPACSGCHRLLDPIGFGFERFDGIGRLLSGTVDTSGEIIGSKASDTKFDGVRDLEQKLAASPDVKGCFAQQWVRFGLGLTDTDSSTAEASRLASSSGAGGPSVQTVLTGMTQAPYFFKRNDETIPPP